MREFPTAEALAEQLADEIAGALSEAIATRGTALLALSGGSTPKWLFDALSDRAIDWGKVTIVPVDERWVDEGSERSNAKLIQDRLLKNSARGAAFVSLHAPTDTPEDGMAEVSARLRALELPFDVLTLGMGADGHTASFFPGGDNLARAVSADSSELVVPMRAPGAGEPRVTMTLPVILRARRIVLHIEGDEKRDVLRAAQAGKDVSEYPVRTVLDARNLEICWAP